MTTTAQIACVVVFGWSMLCLGWIAAHDQAGRGAPFFLTYCAVGLATFILLIVTVVAA